MKKEIVFARTRYDYDSYTDYWKLVELSEFPVVYIDEIDVKDSKVIYIASPFNGEFFPFEESKGDRKCKILLWNLERPSASGGVTEYKNHLSEHIQKGYIDDVIVSDTRLAKATDFSYVPMGSHIGLGSPGDTKEYAFAHLMCYSNRRGILFQEPTKPKGSYGGLRIAPNGWGEERHQSLQRSWAMLNVHQDEDQYLEPLRFALAAAYGLPILSENLYDEPYPYQTATFQFPLDKLGYAMMQGFKSRLEWAKKGLQMRRFVMEYHSFRDCIERYVK